MEYFVIKSGAGYFTGESWVEQIELAEVYQAGKLPWLDVEFEPVRVNVVPAYSSCFCPFCGNRVLHAKKIPT